MIDTKNKLPPLHQAARDGNVPEINQRLRVGDVINDKDSNGNSALHWACAEGQCESALALIKAGADLYSRDICDQIPLCVATKYHHERKAIVLLLLGAMIKQGDKDRQNLNNEESKERQKADELLRQLD